MAGRIRDDDVALVRERTDIVKLVSGYLALKRTGSDSMSGLCPFHTEKSPSFSVSPSKGVYHCFGCGEGGDAIGFLRKVEGLTFAEAVERLARDAGVTLRYEGDTPAARRAASRRQALHDANEKAAELYHRVLMEGKEAEAARAYLQGRGIDADAARTFGIGFAPEQRDFLLRRLAGDGLSPEILVEAGLAVRDGSGAVRDRFRGRVTFPVHDVSGRAIGIGARVLPGDREDGPKYLNSPETPIYRKGETLYNLHRAKGAASKSGEVIVVEGYTDVIALAQAGIETAVATCGTALGEGHFRLASRFARRMVLAFDSDEAGARAAERAFAQIEAFPIQPVVLVLPEGMDPADFVRARGGDALRELAVGARPVVEYMIRRTVARHDLTTIEGQSAAVAAVLPMVARLGDPVRRGEYAHLVAELAGVAETSVAVALERSLAGQTADFRAAASRATAQERVEREMLRMLARHAAIWAQVAPRLEPDHFQGERNRAAFLALREVQGDLRRAMAASDDAPASSDAALAALAVEPLEGDGTPAYAEDVWTRLQEFLLRRRSTAIRQRLASLEPEDPAYDGLFQDLVRSDADLRRLRDPATGSPDPRAGR